jgi:hypothetical protein
VQPADSKPRGADPAWYDSAVADILGIPRRRWPIAVAMIALLAFTLVWLQARFDASDARKAIASAMSWKPAASQSIFDALAGRGEGDPQCTGKVMSQLLGDVEVRCWTPAQPRTEYEFRVLLDGKKPPRAANPAAEQLVGTMVRK